MDDSNTMSEPRFFLTLAYFRPGQKTPITVSTKTKVVVHEAVIDYGKAVSELKQEMDVAIPRLVETILKK